MNEFVRSLKNVERNYYRLTALGRKLLFRSAQRKPAYDPEEAFIIPALLT